MDWCDFCDFFLNEILFCGRVEFFFDFYKISILVLCGSCSVLNLKRFLKKFIFVVVGMIRDD